MCGITGVFSFNEKGKQYHSHIGKATDCLSLRGPDASGQYIHEGLALGHARLSIIDVSEAAAQPFTDKTGRYTIIFNGEFYNFMPHRKRLQEKGYTFLSHSDTEVLLYMYIDEGPAFINKINGFFAFAIYDKIEGSLMLCRDRFGIKPLYVYTDETALIFASEMKSLMAYKIPKQIDNVSLYTFFQLNYIPYPDTIFENVKKLEPGTYLLISASKVVKEKYYTLPHLNTTNPSNVLSYTQAQEELQCLMYDSVALRMIADVPLGAFLSGGIDSSIIVALASQQTKHLNTFSIGFKDEPMFDETNYANLVAAHFNTNHTVFSLSNDDLLANLYDVLDYIDEPFADSSALAVQILSMHTRKHVTVALSGDGADEMFAGYNKHKAEYLVQKHAGLFRFTGGLSPLLDILPQSRQTPMLNKFRQINRLIKGAALNHKERYWLWAALANENDAESLILSQIDKKTYNTRKSNILKHIDGFKADLNNVLYTDMQLVLTNDMLTKVDMMSMANSLEVRVPFLDYRVAEFAFSLPASYKIDGKGRKKILRDAFRNVLPPELYTRNKHGFEVPLLKWFRNELRLLITDDLLADDFVKSQGIFAVEEIAKIKQDLFSSNPKDVHARIWALIVFQYWYKKYLA